MLKKILVLFVIAACALPVIYANAKETKDITYRFKNAGPVVFSHESHLKKYNNNCRMCHDAIYNLRNKKRFTMAEMEKTRSCGACHSGVKAFSVATEKDCSRCHSGKPNNVSYNIRGLGTTVFSHDSHLAKPGVSCKSCHNGKVITGTKKPVTMAQMEKGHTCGACHNGKPTFTVASNCNRCHVGLKPKDITFKLKNFTLATFSHDFHSQIYSCKDCHTKTYAYKAGSAKAVTMDDMAKGKSCGVCHNAKDAFASTGDCAKCHIGLKTGNVPYKTDAGDVTFSHEFHTQVYKCSDCHSKIFNYKAGAQKTTMSGMNAGKSCGACHNKGKDAFAVQGDCEKCHKM